MPGPEEHSSYLWKLLELTSSRYKEQGFAQMLGELVSLLLCTLDMVEPSKLP